MANLFIFPGNPKRLPKDLLFRRSLALFLISLLTFTGFAKSQQTDGKQTVTGIVFDKQKNPLPGVTVVIKGKNQGTVTDINGKYSLNAPGSNAVLVFSYLGFTTQELIVGNKSKINLTLNEGTTALNEVVVVGYGVVRKSDLTGSLTRVSEAQIKERPVQNVVQALQGKATGVDITSNVRPGEVGVVRVRGNRSINASNDPLYVVDGIPLSAGSVADINPNDIESVEILKDASATAIYGSRGANGVILITNKKGAKGKTTIDYDGTYTLSQIHSTTDWMNSGQLLDWQRQAYINGGTYTGKYGTAPDPDFDVLTFGGGETYGQNSIKTAYQWNEDGTVKLREATAEEIARGYAAKVPVYTPEKMFNQNWGKLVSRTGITQNHQISLASGSDKSQVYLSLAYLDQKGTLIDQDYKRYSLNVKGDITPRKWITVGSSLNAFYSKQNYGVAENTANTGAKDSYGQALALMPYARAFDDEGNILNSNKEGLSAHNVLLNIANATNEHSSYSVISNSNAEIRFVPWLKYVGRFGAQFRNNEYGSFYGPDFTNPFSAVGTAPLIGL